MIALACVFASMYFARAKTNASILQGLKEDTKWSAQLLKACNDDHAAGRMSQPRLLHEVCLDEVRIFVELRLHRMSMSSV